MNDPSDIVDIAKRIRLVNPKEPFRDAEGNVTVPAPVAEASAAVIVNPAYSDALGPVCTRCKAPYTRAGVVIEFPDTPQGTPDPLRFCAECVMSFWARGENLKVTFR